MKSEDRTSPTARKHVSDMSDQRLAVELQKMAKDISHHQSKWYRGELLREAAHRLIDRDLGA